MLLIYAAALVEYYSIGLYYNKLPSIKNKRRYSYLFSRNYINYKLYKF